MKNIEVLDAFINKTSGMHLSNDTGSLQISGNCLYTYNTILAQWKNNNFFVNVTSYSVTSSRHKSALLQLIPSYKNYTVFLIDDVPINSSTLFT